MNSLQILCRITSYNVCYTKLLRDSIYYADKGTTDKRNLAVLKVNPAAVFDSDVLKFRIGINSYTVLEKGEGADYMIAPNMKIEYAPAEDVITLYAGTDGS